MAKEEIKLEDLATKVANLEVKVANLEAKVPSSITAKESKVTFEDVKTIQITHKSKKYKPNVPAVNMGKEVITMAEIAEKPELLDEKIGDKTKLALLLRTNAITEI